MTDSWSHQAIRWMAGGLAAATLAGCSGVTTTLRYGTDGQPEFLIDCSGKPLARCYDKALEICPQGYFLVRESQTPGGTASGLICGYPLQSAAGRSVSVSGSGSLGESTGRGSEAKVWAILSP